MLIIARIITITATVTITTTTVIAIITTVVIATATAIVSTTNATAGGCCGGRINDTTMSYTAQSMCYMKIPEESGDTKVAQGSMHVITKIKEIEID